MSRAVPVLRLIVPTLWIGLLVGLSFLEAPLKFQAPGITPALGLGIGRIMFTALAIAGWTLLVAMVALAVARPRAERSDLVLLGIVTLVLAVQSFVIRPPLNARSDIVVAGGDPGESILHYVYIASDVVLLALLVTIVVRAARALTPSR